MKNTKTSCKSSVPQFLYGLHQLFYFLLLAVIVTAAGCALGEKEDDARDILYLTPEDEMLTHKYRGIRGGGLYLSAIGETKHNITMLNQDGVLWRSLLQLGEGGSRHETYTDVMYLPRTLHVTWRADDAIGREGYNGRNGMMYGWEGGTVLGDYIVPLSTRIPDDVLDYIRTQKGALLRIKIRLADHGVLVGWDVEQWLKTKHGRFIDYVMPGGDFREVQIENGKVVERGWMIMPDGSKVETDY